MKRLENIILPHTWSDAVTVEGVLDGHLYPFSDRLLSRILYVKRSPESSRTLLVHFCAGSDAIDGHKEHLLGFDFAEEMLDVIEDSNEHLVLCHAESSIIGVLMRAVVNNTIHVELNHYQLVPPHGKDESGFLHRDNRTLEYDSRR